MANELAPREIISMVVGLLFGDAMMRAQKSSQKRGEGIKKYICS